jgi:hypothetical protein
MSTILMADIIGKFALPCMTPGDYYVADPSAPLEYGCHVAVRVGGRWFADAKLITRRPDMAGTLTVEVAGLVQRRLDRSSVARVVGHYQRVPWRDEPRAGPTA